MKKRIAVKLLSVLSAAALCSSVLLASTSAFADSTETGGAQKTGDDGVMRGVTASQVSAEMGMGINLGNTFEAYWWTPDREDTGAQTIGNNTTKDYETCWGATVTTQNTIDGMKKAGFDTVRIPVYWGNMMENDGTFTVNGDYIARVKEVVDYCRNDGMYVVINMHHYDEFLIRRYTASDDLEGCTQTIKTIWTQIAEYFKDYSDYLVFEGFNEYLGGGPLKDPNDQNKGVNDLPKSEAYEWTNTLNQAFVDAVRSTGGNNAERILIASGYWTNIDNTSDSRFHMPEDTAENKMMVSVHYVDNSMYWTNQIGNQRWRDYSIDQCEKLKKAFTDKGIPVFVGETTANYPNSNFASNADVKTSQDALKYMLELIHSYGFTSVLWDTPGGFYNRNTAEISSKDNALVIYNFVKEFFPNHDFEVKHPDDSSEPDSSSSNVSSVPDDTSSLNDTTSSEPSADSSSSTEDSSSVDSVSSGSDGSSAANESSSKATSSGNSGNSNSNGNTNNANNSSSANKDSSPATGTAAAASVGLILIAAAVVTVCRKK